MPINTPVFENDSDWYMPITSGKPIIRNNPINPMIIPATLLTTKASVISGKIIHMPAIMQQNPRASMNAVLLSEDPLSAARYIINIPIAKRKAVSIISSILYIYIIYL